MDSKKFIAEQMTKIAAYETLPQECKGILNSLITELLTQDSLMSQNQIPSREPQPNTEYNLVEKYKKQIIILLDTLNSPNKISILKDFWICKLVLTFMMKEGIQYFRYSYYNRAKVNKNHIKKLQQFGPIIFAQATMLASKINLINKKNSRIFTEDHLYTQSENPIDIRIQEILKLCDEKKRNVNNNFKKLQLILDGPDSFQVMKKLGKMLRDSWRKDKSKIKFIDFVKPTKFHANKQQQARQEQKCNQDKQESISIKEQNAQNPKQQQNQFERQSCSQNLSFDSIQKIIISQMYANANNAKQPHLPYDFSQYDIFEPESYQENSEKKDDFGYRDYI